MSRPYQVYQHWDPLEICVVGRSYPPEFYSWISDLRVRKLFERIAIETEEDFQGIIRTLESFGVEIWRPDIPQEVFADGKYYPPPMNPRDVMLMLGEDFYFSHGFDTLGLYNAVRAQHWPDWDGKDLLSLPLAVLRDLFVSHDLGLHLRAYTAYDRILQRIKAQNNCVIDSAPPIINGAMVTRVGRDIYIGTDINGPSATQQAQSLIKQRNPDCRVHVVDTQGHSDGTFCPVAPGLIISLYDVPTYADTFPDWEVVYLPGQSWDAMASWLDIKGRVRGRWWLPGFENDHSVIDVIDTWMSHWVGYAAETVFDVNMLVIDPKNVLMFGRNDIVERALDRYGITAHVTAFRHRYFWDGGIHCVTTDIQRRGTRQDYFPGRNGV